MIKRLYYGFEFKSGRHTTWQLPNVLGDKWPIAGKLEAFASILARDQWVDDGKVTADMQGNCREAITCTQARKMLRHLTRTQFDYYIDTHFRCDKW